MDRNTVPLLDPATDRVVGAMDKLQAHVEGRYHAAVSVLVFRADGAQMVQKRAPAKYHSAGLWANACCSHPMPGEPALAAATRRLAEEMGVAAPLQPLGVIRYRAPVRDPQGRPMVEHERVDLFAGVFEGAADPDPDEASDWRWSRAPADDLGAEMLAPWFALYLRLIAPPLPNAAPVDFGTFELDE